MGIVAEELWVVERWSDRISETVGASISREWRDQNNVPISAWSFGVSYGINTTWIRWGFGQRGYLQLNPFRGSVKYRSLGQAHTGLWWAINGSVMGLSCCDVGDLIGARCRSEALIDELGLGCKDGCKSIRWVEGLWFDLSPLWPAYQSNWMLWQAKMEQRNAPWRPPQ